MQTIKKTIGFPFIFTNRGGSYYSASMIVKLMIESSDYDIVVFLPEKGIIDDLFSYKDVEIEYYNVSNRVQKKLYLSYGIVKKFLSIPYQILLYFKVLKALKNHQCDLLHVNDDATLIPWGLAARTKKVPVIWNVRQDKGNKFLDIVRRKIATYLIFNSIASSKRFKKKSEYEIVIYNLFDSTFNYNKTNNFDDSDNEYTTIGFVGSLQKRKRLEWFLKASIHASKKFSKLMFVVAGPDYSSGHYLKLINQTKLNMNGNSELKYLGEVSNIETVFQSLDIFCLTSITESFGRVVIEALLSDTAVIATNVGGVNEIIEDGYNGILVNPDEYEDFETALIRLIDSKDERAKLSKNGKKILKYKFDPKKQINKLKYVYSQIMESKVEKN